VYDGNILNNFVPMLGDLILIKKKTGRMNMNIDCCCYHWTVMEEMMYRGKDKGTFLDTFWNVAILFVAPHLPAM
jgi:hypothetical protein